MYIYMFTIFLLNTILIELFSNKNNFLIIHNKKQKEHNIEFIFIPLLGTVKSFNQAD